MPNQVRKGNTMNQPMHEYPPNCLISFRLLLLFALVTVLVGCATPEMTRKFASSRDMQLISATRPLVAACILQQLKTTTSHEIIESAESVQLKSGEVTLRIYDLEDWVGGTMVTLYVNSSLHMKKARLVIDHCRGQLESPKPPPQSPAN
jgi:hypothetical protein